MEALRLFKKAREYLTPVLQESAFISRGMLTPEEFIIAGDQLVHTCPTWTWASGEPSQVRPYLPPNKQFLTTKGVPSYRRVTEMNTDVVQDKVVESGLTGDEAADWCAPELLVASDDSTREVQLAATQTIDRSDEYITQSEDSELGSSTARLELSAFIDENHFASAVAVTSTATEPTLVSGDKSDLSGDCSQAVAISVPKPDGVVMKATVEDSTKTTSLEANAVAVDELEDDNLALDDATVQEHPKASWAGGMYLTAEAPDDEETTLSSRRYDISITYDNYYRTPRVWLFGFDENGSALKPEAVFQDIMTDYAHRTVTLDPHPHLTRPHASIHPCQHGAAMKRIIDELVNGGKVPTVDQYMFIFLKFIQSVVPTIEYDYTMDVQVGKRS